MEVYNKRKIIIVIICIAILLISYYIYDKISDSDYASATNLNVEEVINIEEMDINVNLLKAAGGIIDNATEEKMVIHIIGEVKKEGIIYIKKKSRIIDAIEEAGGATDKADLSKINLAFELEDSMKIYIPSIEDKETKKYIYSESGDNVLVEKGNTSILSKKEEKKMININTANEQELQNLPGIGSSTATKIINYRKENGKFNKIEDIKNVSGIGEAKFNKMKDFINV